MNAKINDVTVMGLVEKMQAAPAGCWDIFTRVTGAIDTAMTAGRAADVGGDLTEIESLIAFQNTAVTASADVARALLSSDFMPLAVEFLVCAGVIQ